MKKSPESSPGQRDGHLSLINLPRLMQLTTGRPDVVVGLLDGPVAPHPDLTAGSPHYARPRRCCGISNLSGG